MRRRHLTSLLWLGALLLAACERLPDEVVYATGNLRDEAGAPISDHEVVLFQADDECDTGFGKFDANGNQLPPVVKELRRTKTDAQGVFTFDMLIAELHPDRDVGTCLTAQAGTFETGQVQGSSYRYLEDGDAELKDLVLFRTAPVLNVQPEGGMTLQGNGPKAGALQVSEPTEGETIDAMLESYGVFPWTTFEVWGTSAAAEGRMRGAPVWLTRRGDAPVPLEPELLEDFADVRAVMAVREARHEGETINPVDELARFSGHLMRATSPPVALTSAGRIPVTRGRPCTLHYGLELEVDEPEEPVPPCPFTNGLVDDDRMFAVTAIDIPLEKPVHPKRLVLRALRAKTLRGPVVVRVSGSVDGKTYVELGLVPVIFVSTQFVALQASGMPEEASVYFWDEQGALGYAAGALEPSAEPVAHLRVEFVGAQWSDLGALGEVSIFD